MEIATPTSAALERYLSLSTAELRLTASNMANIDTPGYRTQGFDFQQELARQMQDPQELAGALSTAPEARPVDGLVARPDGNNVSMDREGLQLAKAQMQFKLGVLLIKSEFSMVSSAIHASDGK
jgi:flagellar basal-body rod protein FlgB